MFHFLAEIGPLDQLTNLGAAGVMGAMWLWERRTSRAREQQLEQAHGRIMSDRVQLEQLIAVVRQNSEALTRLSESQQQLLRSLSTSPPHHPMDGVNIRR